VPSAKLLCFSSSQERESSASRAHQDFTEVAQLCHRACDELAIATAEGDLARPGLLSLVARGTPNTLGDLRVHVGAFVTERGLEALQEQLVGMLEEARAGHVHLLERVARFPQQADDLLGEERAIAGEAVVCK